MANIGQVIFFSLIGGIFSLIGGLILLMSKKNAQQLARYVTPFAGGALLAAVFLDLLRDGVKHDSADTVLLATLMGIIIFFLAEGFLRWFHYHHEGQSEKQDTSVPLIIVGDTIHNALDGVAIATAFLISAPTGIITTIAVAAHEIPQEIGDFGLLLARGMKRSKVLLINVLSALATTLMAVTTFMLGSGDKVPTGVLLGISAGFLLYIATSDIIPTVHQHSKKSRKLFDLQALLLVLGAVIVGLSIQIAHTFIDVESHSHDDHAITEQHTEVEPHSDEGKEKPSDADHTE
jgi:zinc and cadmium transporter